jgi:ribosome-binding factor A
MTARGYIRSQLRERMGVRHVPELTFAIDRSQKLTGRIDEILSRSRAREARSRKRTRGEQVTSPTGSDVPSEQRN